MQALDDVLELPAFAAGDDEDSRFSGDLAFSLRLQFPDAWDDLTRPHTLTDPAFTMRARISTTREDFPPHVDDLTVHGLAMYCLHQQGFAEEVGIASLSLVHTSARRAAGVPSTRGATSVPPLDRASDRWPELVGSSPIGDWTIQLEVTDTLRNWCRSGEMMDLVFVITVDGVVAHWT